MRIRAAYRAWLVLRSMLGAPRVKRARAVPGRPGRDEVFVAFDLGGWGFVRVADHRVGFVWRSRIVVLLADDASTPPSTTITVRNAFGTTTAAPGRQRPAGERATGLIPERAARAPLRDRVAPTRAVALHAIDPVILRSSLNPAIALPSLALRFVAPRPSIAVPQLVLSQQLALRPVTLKDERLSPRVHLNGGKK